MKPSSSAGDPRGGDGVGGVAEDEHALAGQIGRVDRARVPGQPRRVARRAPAPDRRRRARATSAMKSRVAPTPIGTVVVIGWPKFRCSHCAAWPAISGYSTTLKSASPSRARSAGVAPSGATTLTSMPSRSSRPVISRDVVAMAEAERGRAEHVAARPDAGSRAGRFVPGAGACGPAKRAHQLIEGLGRAPVLLPLVGRQFERHDRDRQAERARQAAGIVLDQFARCRTRRPAAPAAGSARRPRAPRS